MTPNRNIFMYSVWSWYVTQKVLLMNKCCNWECKIMTKTKMCIGKVYIENVELKVEHLVSMILKLTNLFNTKYVVHESSHLCVNVNHHI